MQVLSASLLSAIVLVRDAAAVELLNSGQVTENNPLGPIIKCAVLEDIGEKTKNLEPLYQSYSGDSLINASTVAGGIADARVGNFVGTLDQLNGNGLAAYDATAEIRRTLPALEIVTQTETHVEHEEASDSKFASERCEEQAYTLKGSINKGKIDYGLTCGNEDVCIYDSGTSVGSHCATGDIIDREDTCKCTDCRGKEIDPFDGGEDAQVFDDFDPNCFSEIDIVACFDDSTCADPSQAIEDRIYAQIDEEINNMVN